MSQKGRAQKRSQVGMKAKLGNVYIHKHFQKWWSDVTEGQSPIEEPGGEKDKAGWHVDPQAKETVVIHHGRAGSGRGARYEKRK